MQKKNDNNKLLKLIFFILLIILFILLIICIKKNPTNKKSNISIPLISDNLVANLAVDITNLKVNEKMEYTFDITNYKNNTINNKDIEYNIEFKTESNISVKLNLYKNNNDIDILKNHKEVKKESLLKNKKETNSYKLIIKLLEKSSENTSEKNYITIKIVGSEK